MDLFRRAADQIVLISAVTAAVAVCNAAFGQPAFKPADAISALFNRHGGNIELLGAAACGLVGLASVVLWVSSRRAARLRVVATELEHENDALRVRLDRSLRWLEDAESDALGVARIVGGGIRPAVTEILASASTAAAAIGDEAPAAVAEPIEAIKVSAHRIDRTIDGILTLSNGLGDSLSPIDVDVPILLDRLTAQFDGALREHDIEFVAKKPWPRLVTDAGVLERILALLIDNAIRSMPAGQPGKMVVSGRRDGTMITLSVFDTSAVIDASLGGTIFDLIPPSGGNDQAGNRVGLTTARALARLIGGSLEHDSVSGCGSRFSLILPTAPPLATALPHTQTGA